ncbi:MAG TPA: M15 family metallopeptidase [Chthonomonadaceae bacterium]|nr:M15 family metallopeptidase [Chthonomonadaceae bacterium]
MPSRAPSPAEPVSALRYVPIVECSEELVNFLALCPDLLLDRPRFRYRRETLLRRTVAERLCEANRRLPGGYRLAVIEGWRPPHIQRRMYQAIWNRFQSEHPDWSATKLKRVVNRFSAPLDPRVPPPYTTGGAVDVMLADASGRLLDHGSPYEPYDSRSFPFDAPGLSETARRTRALLAAALLSTGLTNYPSEYWHWSYGDQGWAYRSGYDHALYGAIAPPGWQPAPEDLADAPLEWIG